MSIVLGMSLCPVGRAVRYHASLESSFVNVLQQQEEIYISLVGDPRAINTGFASAVAAEGWHITEFPSLAALLAQPLPYCTIVLLPVQTITAYVEIAIRQLAGTLALPVVIFCPAAHTLELQSVINAGAEDCIFTPTTIEEAIARLGAVIRVRCSGIPRGVLASDYLLESTTCMVSVGGDAPVRLTLSEYQVLRLLLRVRNQLVPHAHLRAILKLYQSSEDKDEGEDALITLIGRLQRKVGPGRLVAVRGAGYLLRDFADAKTMEISSQVS